MTPPITLLIVPTFNEKENLPLLVDALMQYENVNVLVVDDASPDGTGDIAEALGRTHPGRIEVMHRTAQRGLGRSYIDGIRLALTRPVDVICQMDADLSHDPRQLPALVAGTERADVVIGSRYVPGGAVVNWPRRRQFLSRFANSYVHFVTGLTTRDCTAGYRCYSRAVLEGIDPFDIRASGYSFLEEIVWRVHHAGFAIREIPIVFEDRRLGVSKIDQVEIVRAARHVLLTALRPTRRAPHPAVTPR